MSQRYDFSKFTPKAWIKAIADEGTKQEMIWWLYNTDEENDRLRQLVKALKEAVRPDEAPRQPAAWLVPHLIDLKGCGGRALADHDGKKAALIDGTVAWSAEIFCDSQKRGVIDRNGVTHFAKPLYERVDGPSKP